MAHIVNVGLMFIENCQATYFTTWLYRFVFSSAAMYESSVPSLHQYLVLSDFPMSARLEDVKCYLIVYCASPYLLIYMPTDLSCSFFCEVYVQILEQFLLNVN